MTSFMGYDQFVFTVCASVRDSGMVKAKLSLYECVHLCVCVSNHSTMGFAETHNTFKLTVRQLFVRGKLLELLG